jgi:hypothetical protein
MGRVASLKPVHVGVLGCLMALGVVFGRLLVPADGDISRFVVAGDRYADPAAVDPPIHVIEDSWGYDGQFFWRLAVDPLQWELGRHHHGVIFDSAYRPSRPGYPVVAWALSGGHAPWAATALVATNVLAFGVVAGLGALIAQRAGKLPITGLLVATTPGLVFALARDLSDVVALAGVVAGIVALQRRRYGWATAAWVGAVATREQALVVIAGYGLWRLVTVLRSMSRAHARAGAGEVEHRTDDGLAADDVTAGPPTGAVQASPSVLLAGSRVEARHPANRTEGAGRFGRADLPWLLPGVVVVAIQLLVWARVGTLPLVDGQDSNFTYPFGSLGPTLWDWLRGDTQPWDDVVPFQFALAVALVVLAFRYGRSLLPEGERWLLVSLALVVATAVSFGEKVWEGPSDLRQVLDVLALSWVILLAMPRRLPPWLIGASGVIWLATAAMRAYTI